MPYAIIFGMELPLRRLYAPSTICAWILVSLAARPEARTESWL
jgi:hypothetical protein